MCEKCEEAIRIQEELSAKYGKMTVEALLRMEPEDHLKRGRMVKILAACPKTPEFLGREGAYHLAVLTDMKNQ